jgi:hypothetical protein
MQMRSWGEGWRCSQISEIRNSASTLRQSELLHAKHGNYPHNPKISMFFMLEKLLLKKVPQPLIYPAKENTPQCGVDRWGSPLSTSFPTKTCIRIITLFIESHFWAPSFVKRARFSIGKPTHRTHHGTHSRVHEFRVSDVRGAHHIPNPLR